MTVAGEAALREELTDLKSVQRPAVIAAIAEAREHGDLKENAEYAAREQQGFIEGRIQELEGKLSNAVVIDVNSIENTGKVIFGVTVTLLNVDTDQSVTYRIVGEDEADVKKGMLSVHPPSLVRSSARKRAMRCIDTPGGTVTYEIETVEHI